jgi:hypothetical protein
MLFVESPVVASVGSVDAAVGKEELKGASQLFAL